jgi:hypothetical protein
LKKLPILALIAGAIAWAVFSRGKKRDHDDEPGDEYPYEYAMSASGASDTSPSEG